MTNLADHRIMNARHGEVACFCGPDWMTLDEYGDHVEHVAAIVEREHREAEWGLIDDAGITWQSRARRLAFRQRENEPWRCAECGHCQLDRAVGSRVTAPGAPVPIPPAQTEETER